MCSSSFTFHYVSIKTIAKNFNTPVTFNLFTFHYVSIKTKKFDKADMYVYNLHSTMYLLKPELQYTVDVFSTIYIPLCIY